MNGQHDKANSPSAARVDPDRVEQIAQRIYTARKTGKPTENLPQHLYPTWQEIYPVHDRVHELLGNHVVGWKVGAASKEVQLAEGMPEPIAGRIYEHGLHDDGAVVTPDRFIGFRLCESEFVLTIGEDLPAGTGPLDRATVENALSTVRPGLEVGDMVFPDWYGTSPFWGACLDNAGGSQLILGAPTPYSPSLDLANATMTLFKNGQTVRQGTGAAAMGDPVESALWLVNLRRKAGDRITAGSLLSTGTCTGHCFSDPGDEMKIDFGDLGTVSATFAK